MKVFIVMAGEYSDYGFEGVFSTEEKAKAFTELFKKCNGIYTNCDIIEQGVDEYENYQLCTIYRECMDVESGAIEDYSSEYVKLKPPGYRCCEVVLGTHPNPYIYASSTVSKQHAIKLCAEKRQAILREVVK